MDAAFASLHVASVPTAARAGSSKRRIVDNTRGTSKGVDDVAMKLILNHDNLLRMVVSWAEDAYKVPLDSPLSQTLAGSVASWKSQKPSHGPHPHGDIKATIFATFIQYVSKFKVGEAPGMQSQLQGLTALGNEITSSKGLRGLETHVASAVAKETKQGGFMIFKFILDIRSPIRQFYDIMEFVISAEKGEKLEGKQPRGPLARALEAQMM